MLVAYAVLAYVASNYQIDIEKMIYIFKFHAILR